MNRNLLPIYLLMGIISVACKSNQQEEQKITSTPLEIKGATLIADSIKYDVVTRAIDSEDTWETERLTSFKQDVFINYIFDQLYTGKFSAYDFFTHKLLTKKEIKDIEGEPGFNRQQISKAQFNEQWYIDSIGVLNKRVNSITFGIESYSSQKTFLGHKALFIVKFEPNAQ